MIGFLTQDGNQRTAIDIISEHWIVTKYSPITACGTINGDTSFKIITAMETLRASELSVFYCIGPVSPAMQIAAWSRAGRAK